MLIGLSLSAVIPCAGETDPAEPKNSVDSRLLKVLAKFRRGEKISVVTLGGSITTGYSAQPPEEKGWAGLVNNWFRDKAGETGAHLEYINAGVGGTDSAYGVMRAKNHVLAYDPDLVIVEFAVNDQWLDPKVRQRSYEGLMRQLLDGSSRSIIILSLNEKGSQEKSTYDEQVKIGAYYGLPVLGWANWVEASDWNAYFPENDEIHPNDAGHANIASGIINFLEAAWNRLPADDKLPPVAVDLPKALISGEFQNIRYISGNDGMETNLESSGWVIGPADLPGDWEERNYEALTGWSTTGKDAELGIRVKGKSVGVLFTESDQFQNGTAWLVDPDGAKTYPRVEINSYVSYRNEYFGHAYVEVADNLDASKEYLLHLALGSGGKQGGKTNALGIICTNA